ncbi:MAG: hypothetical protein Q9212_004290 [Teloschistes hypoglaucus]
MTWRLEMNGHVLRSHLSIDTSRLVSKGRKADIGARLLNNNGGGGGLTGEAVEFPDDPDDPDRRFPNRPNGVRLFKDKPQPKPSVPPYYIRDAYLMDTSRGVCGLANPVMK